MAPVPVLFEPVVIDIVGLVVYPDPPLITLNSTVAFEVPAFLVVETIVFNPEPEPVPVTGSKISPVALLGTVEVISILTGEPKILGASKASNPSYTIFSSTKNSP